MGSTIQTPRVDGGGDVRHTRAAAEWKEDREKITKAMKRAIGMAGRIPYLCADQLGEMMGMIMGGVIGYLWEGNPD